jgi:hypothetical protein
MSDHKPASKLPHSTISAPWPPADTLSPAARHVLGHIRGRTITGRVACPLWDMPSATWDAALDELRCAGYPITWTLGQVLDEPTITGGYLLR